jgi:RNA polymerase sigma factor (sigma-70 family)
MNPDRALVDAVLARTPGAFETLVREYQGLCWHIIQRIVRNPDDARELCQETMLRVHQSLHQYRHESALKSWIGRIAYSIALRHLERRRITVVDTDTDDDGGALHDSADTVDLEAACGDDENARLLHAAIERLPTVQRAVLTLYHLDELSLAEIADVTGLAAGTIKSHLFRARLRLRDLLAAPLGVSA